MADIIDFEFYRQFRVILWIAKEEIDLFSQVARELYALDV